MFRTLVADDIPLNDGCLRLLQDIVIPDASMLTPEYPAAVVAGNVETSQAVTGALYAALRVQAGGRRNDEQRHFRQRSVPVLHETLGSGSGAGDGFDGTSVVQTMTNSRLTDPEVFEWRYMPVLLEEFSDPRRQRRRRSLARRRRRYSADPVPRADDRQHPVRASAGCRRTAWPAANRERSAQTGSNAPTAR